MQFHEEVRSRRGILQASGNNPSPVVSETFQFTGSSLWNSIQAWIQKQNKLTT